MRRVARATSRACDEPPHERHRRRHYTSSCRRVVAPHARPGPGESLPWCEEQVPRRRRRVRRHRRRPELQRKGNIEHSRQHTSNYIVLGSSTTTCSRARARSFSSNICLSSVTLALSLLRSSSRWQPHSQDRNSPGHEPPHFHSSSRFRLFLLSSSLALWLTGSLTQGGSRDGIESYLTGQSSDTQPLQRTVQTQKLGRILPKVVWRLGAMF